MCMYGIGILGKYIKDFLNFRQCYIMIMKIHIVKIHKSQETSYYDPTQVIKTQSKVYICFLAPWFLKAKNMSEIERKIFLDEKWLLV